MERGRERSSTARELERELREGLEAGVGRSEGSVGWPGLTREVSVPVLLRGGIVVGVGGLSLIHI